VRDIDRITGDVLDAAIQLHRELGPGLLESVYETVLAGQLVAQRQRRREAGGVSIPVRSLRACLLDAASPPARYLCASASLREPITE
jgi:PD-(D/E)XK nuclease superfamily